MARLSPGLERFLQTAKPGDLVEVVLEMRAEPSSESLPSDRGERAKLLGEQFASTIETVVDDIKHIGGTVLGGSWLASAIKVRIPVEAIDGLRSLDRIHLIDLPRKITR
jgi:hypothetical protein